MVNMDSFDVTSFLTAVKSTVESHMTTGLTSLQDPLLALLSALAIISILTQWEMYFGNYNYGNLIVKLLHIGFVGAMIKDWKTLMDVIRESAATLGALVGGVDAPVKVETFISVYSGKIMGLWSHVLDKAELGTFLISLVGLVIIIISFFAIFKIGYEVFSANMEFTIIGTLLVVLLPFQVLGYTKDFGNKAWGGLFTLFCKLMVVTFFFALVVDMMDSAITTTKYGGNDTIPNLIIQVAALIFLAYLMSQATQMVNAIVQGAVINGGNPMQRATQVAGNAAAYGAGRVGGMIRQKAPVAARAAGQGVVNAGRAIGNAIQRLIH